MPDRRRLPPLKALRVLEALHQTGSVTGAAQRLHVSHSAVSHQVRLLDDWSTVPLFVRQGRLTRLTEAGRSLAIVAHGAFDAIRHEVDRLPMRQSRSVSVAALPIVANALIVPNMAGFAARMPEVRLHLALAHADRPAGAEPDIEILFARSTGVLAADRRLLPGEAVMVCAPALLAAHGGDCDRLIREGPLIQDEDLRMWPAWFAASGLTHAAGLGDSGFILEGSSLLHGAAVAGVGVGFARRALIRDDLAANRLVQVSDIAIDHDWSYILRRNILRADDPDVTAVCDWLCSLGAPTPAAC